MKRYTDIDALSNELGKRWNVSSDQDFADREVWRALREAPTINIVRCKECKYGSDNKVYGCSLINFNTDEWHRMYADDFCSRGERKESE